MKAVLVALVLALGLFAAVRGDSTEVEMSTGNDNVAFVPAAAELDAESGQLDMDTDTSEEELLDSEFESDNDAGEADSESELEGDAEDAAADAAEADAVADAEAVEQFEQEDENESEQETEGELEEDMSFAEIDSSEAGPMGRRRKGKAKKRPLIAPRPLMQPIKFHSERIVAKTARTEDPEMAKLNLALEAVKQDILSTNKQITDERKWVIAVAKIIASYNQKMKRVEAHIIALRKEMKALYRKKKQIENLKLQKALEAKLREAREELATLTNSLKHVAVKQGELNRSGADLRQTIAGIQSQLAKLRGQQLRKPRPAAKGKRRGRKGRRGGRRGCRRGFRFSRKAKRCVPKRK